MEFKLNEDQVKRLNEWKESIKDKHGAYGHFTYTFSPYGMGIGVDVFSDLAKEHLDLSDVDKW